MRLSMILNKALLGRLTGCSSPLKEAALDSAVLREIPLPANYLHPLDHGELQVETGSQWLGEVRVQPLVFAGYRDNRQQIRYVLVVSCDPGQNLLRLLPLRDGETPLSVLSSNERRRQLKKQIENDSLTENSEILNLKLDEVLAENRLTSPLPPPRHIFAVAANYPSHFRHDLAVNLDREQIDKLKRARPRVFLKYPPTPPPTGNVKAIPDFARINGPFDDLLYPPQTLWPTGEDVGSVSSAPTHLDYEAEIGLVIGRRLTWQDIENADDQKLWDSVAGYLLVSDAKARDPQVAQKLVRMEKPLLVLNPSYRIGEASLDEALGEWDRETCQWWSYAAGWGRYSNLGPFFETAMTAAEPTIPPRPILSARSYSLHDGHRDIPAFLHPDIFYLRQGSLVTGEPDQPDALIWEVPAIIRSILNPVDNALAFNGTAPVIEAGDIISLGTPGGTTITAKPGWAVGLLRGLLFWNKPEDWHSFFFQQNEDYYLQEGDELFLWAEGLGFQQFRIRKYQPLR